MMTVIFYSLGGRELQVWENANFVPRINDEVKIWTGDYSFVCDVLNVKWISKDEIHITVDD